MEMMTVQKLKMFGLMLGDKLWIDVKTALPPITDPNNPEHLENPFEVYVAVPGQKRPLRAVLEPDTSSFPKSEYRWYIYSDIVGWTYDLEPTHWCPIIELPGKLNG